ncbi:MAG: hypothetical protein ACI8ZM_001311 [Crocinitomix sp.]|jgi:hypothetical protein
MKTNTVKWSLFAIASVMLFACIKDDVKEEVTTDKIELNSPTEFPAQLKDNSHMDKLDMTDYEYDDAKDLAADSGCGGAVDARAADDELGLPFECCKINSLTYYGPPSWPAQVVHYISGPNAWEATDWLLRFTLIDNTTGDVVFDFFTNDNSYDLRLRCSDSYPGAVFLGSIGTLCPNDYTYTLSRYYEWLDSGILYKCCSKSMDVNLPVNPALPACG